MLLPNQPHWEGWGDQPLIDAQCHIFIAGILNQHNHVYEYSPAGDYVADYAIPYGSTRSGTASSSVKDPAWWCSNARTAPRPAVPGSTQR